MNMGNKIARRLFQGSFLGLCLAVFLPQTVHADFSGYYDPANWTLTNTNADGSVNTISAPFSITLIGGNNGSDDLGTTDFTITAPAVGFVTFDIAYFSTDSPNFDSAGFLLNGIYTPMATASGQSGPGIFPVTVGDVFGFRVETTDNNFGAAQMTVLNFSAPIPEPTTWLMIVAGGTLLVALRYRHLR